MKNVYFVIFVFYVALFVIALANENQNVQEIPEVIAVTIPKSLHTAEVNSASLNLKIAEEGNTAQIEEELPSTIIPETEDSSENLENDTNGEATNQPTTSMEIFDDVQENITLKITNTMKRDTAAFVEPLTVEKLQACSCGVEARNAGHSETSTIMIHDMMCEFRKLWHYMVIIQRNLNSEFSFELPFTGQEEYSLIDFLLSGSLFGYIESSLIEMEIFLKHQENIDNLIKIIQASIPISDIKENLNRLEITINNFVNYTRGLKMFETVQENKKYNLLLSELREEILAEVQYILNFIYKNLPNRVNERKNIFLTLASTVNSMFDIFIKKSSLQKAIDNIIVNIRGYPIQSVVIAIESLVPTLAANLVSIVFRIPLILQNGKIPTILPPNSTFKVQPGVPDIPCTCEHLHTSYPTYPPFPWNIGPTSTSAPQNYLFSIPFDSSPQTTDSSQGTTQNSGTWNEPTLFPLPDINYPISAHNVALFNQELTESTTTTALETSLESTTSDSPTLFQNLLASKVKLNPIFDIQQPTVSTKNTEFYSETTESSTLKYSPGPILLESILSTESPKSESTSSITLPSTNTAYQYILPSTSLNGEDTFVPSIPLFSSPLNSPEYFTTSRTLTKTNHFPEVLPSNEESNIPNKNVFNLFTSLRPSANSKLANKPAPRPHVKPFKITDNSCKNHYGEECESSSPRQPHSVFGKIMESFIKSNARVSSPSIEHDGCGTTVFVAPFSNLSTILYNTDLSKLPLHLPTKEIASALPNTVPSAGDMVVLFIKHHIGLVGYAVNESDPITFHRCKVKFAPACPEWGVKILYVPLNDFSKPVCQHKLRHLCHGH